MFPLGGTLTPPPRRRRPPSLWALLCPPLMTRPRTWSESWHRQTVVRGTEHKTAEHELARLEYASFLIFICQSKMRRHNGKDEYKPHGGHHQKCWFETCFTIHLVLHRLSTWIISLTKYMITSLLSLMFCINLNFIFNVYPA